MAAKSSCLPIYDIGGGQIFALQNVQSGEYLSAVSGSYLKQISTSPNDTRVWFTYDTATLQIRSVNDSRCIDDLGNGFSSQSSTNDFLTFSACDGSFTQQFVYQPDTRFLLNPNNPYYKCIDGNPSLSTIFLYYCPDGIPNHQWTITLICPPGAVRSCPYSIHKSCSPLLLGAHTNFANDTSCSLCPAGTYTSSMGTIGSCSPCSAGHTQYFYNPGYNKSRDLLLPWLHQL